MNAPPALPIALLAAAAFLSSSGSRVIDPLLEIVAEDYATTVPGVSMIIAAFTLPYGLCQILLGPLGDRFGKLRVLLAGLALYAVASCACALAGSLSALTLLRALAGGTAGAVIPIAMAYIAEAVPYAERQIVLSRFLNGIVLSQLLAGPIGGVFGQYVGWRGVFILLGLGSAAVSTILLLRLRALPDRASPGAGMGLAAYAALARSPRARLILLAALLDGAVMAGAFPYLAPFMHERFGLGYAAVGMILSCFGVGAYGYTRLARRLIPRLGEPGMVLAGGIAMALGVAGATLTPAWPGLIATQTAIGFGFFLLHGVLQARATEMLPTARATAVASFAFTLFVGQAAGALAMAGLIAATSTATALTADAACLLALGLWLRALLRGPRFR